MTSYTHPVLSDDSLINRNFRVKFTPCLQIGGLNITVKEKKRKNKNSTKRYGAGEREKLHHKRLRENVSCSDSNFRKLLLNNSLR